MNTAPAIAPKLIKHGYTYKGFAYEMEEDIEPNENCKIFHDVKLPSGKLIPLDFSPYQEMTEEFFCQTVDRMVSDVQ